MSEQDSSQSASASASKKSNALIAFFRDNPLVGIAGSIASVIGIPLTIYLYFASNHEPRLTYYVHPVRAALVQTGKMSDFRVLFKGELLPGDVSAAQIEIWNSGSAPIKSEDVLSPVLIQTENNAPILEISVQKISRPVTEISIDQAQIHSGIAGIHWRILEHDDACVLQIIYLGSTGVKLSLTGDIVGQKQLKEYKYLGTISTPEEQYGFGGNVWWLGIGLNILCWIILFGGIYLLWRFIRSCLPGTRSTSWSQKFFFLMMSLCFLTVSIVFLLALSRPEPPLDF